MKRHLHLVGVEAHDRHNHVCILKKALYELIRNPWDNTYMRSSNITQSDEDINLFYKVEDEILQRMTSSQMCARRTLSRQRILVSSEPNWMENLLMDLGVTESKPYSNLCFKVEGGIPVMIMLYVDELSLTEKMNSLKLQEADLLPILR